MSTEKRYYPVPYNRIPKTAKRRFLFFGIIICYASCWAVYFGFMNKLIWIGPVTLPMAWTFLMNACNTVFVYLMYRWLYADVVFEPQEENDDPKI